MLVRIVIILIHLHWLGKMIETAMNKAETDPTEAPACLKMLMLTWEFPPNIVGGLSKHAFGLAQQLSQLKVEVHVLTAGIDEFLTYENMDNIHVHRVKPLNEKDEDFLSWIGGLNLAMLWKAAELNAENKFMIVHAHDWLVSGAALALTDLLNIPLLTTIHATECGRNNGIHNEMQRFIHEKETQLMKKSNHIIVCSEYMREELVSIFQLCEDNITVIPNGVETIRQAKVPLQDVVTEMKGKTLIFSVGRIVKEKGFETIIKAAELVKKRRQRIFFVIGGRGPLLEEYRRYVKVKKLENQIAFVGYITDEEKNGWILESDMIVCPSLYEPFGIVALEAMSNGKPTIVSEVGGLKGIIKHMMTGLLIAPGNAESLLEQIYFVQNNLEKAKEIGEQGLKVVQELYSWKLAAIRTKRVMEDTVIHARIKD